MMREDEPKFHVWAEAIVQAADRDPRDRRPSAGVQSALAGLGGYMMGLIEARRSAPRDDMLSRLVHDNGDLAMDGREAGRLRQRPAADLATLAEGFPASLTASDPRAPVAFGFGVRGELSLEWPQSKGAMKEPEQ